MSQSHRGFNSPCSTVKYPDPCSQSPWAVPPLPCFCLPYLPCPPRHSRPSFPCPVPLSKPAAAGQVTQSSQTPMLDMAFMVSALVTLYESCGPFPQLTTSSLVISAQQAKHPPAHARRGPSAGAHPPACFRVRSARSLWGEHGGGEASDPAAQQRKPALR